MKRIIGWLLCCPMPRATAAGRLTWAVTSGPARNTPRTWARSFAWAHAKFGRPVWVVGTSRGTHSAATAAQRLHDAQAPDGFVLTSTIMGRSRFGESTAPPLTELDLTGLKQAVLVVHHEQDPCGVCPPAQLPELMKHLPATAVLKTYTGGQSRGGPCDPWSHHGFNGIEDRVVADIAGWIQERK